MRVEHSVWLWDVDSLRLAGSACVTRHSGGRRPSLHPIELPHDLPNRHMGPECPESSDLHPQVVVEPPSPELRDLVGLSQVPEVPASPASVRTRVPSFP